MEKNCSCFASFLSIYREHMYFDYILFLPQLNNKASPIYKNVLNGKLSHILHASY